MDQWRKVRETITKTIRGASSVYYRYHIVAPINHGLSRQDKPLPAGIPIQLTFTRAIAEKALLTVDSSYTFPEKSVTIINPILSCYFVESTKADQLYARRKMYDVGINFLDYSL